MNLAKHVLAALFISFGVMACGSVIAIYFIDGLLPDISLSSTLFSFLHGICLIIGGILLIKNNSRFVYIPNFLYAKFYLPALGTAWH